MIIKPTARPAKTPARAAVVKKTARKSIAAKKVVKQAKAKRPQAKSSAVDPALAEMAAAKIRASVAARKKTIAATTVFPGPRRPTPALLAEGDGPRFAIKKHPARKAGVKRLGASRERRRTAVDRLNDLPHDAPLADRVTNAIACELDIIQNIIGRKRADEVMRTEAERRARTLASLARTLTELKKAQGGTEQRPVEDDDRPRDIDELRRCITQRLARRVSNR